MRLASDHDSNRRSSKQSIVLDIPTHLLENRVTRSRQRGEVRDCRSSALKIILD